MYRKFIQYKHLKNKPCKHRYRYYPCILLDEITAKNKALRDFEKQTSKCEKVLLNNTTT